MSSTRWPDPLGWVLVLIGLYGVGWLVSTRAQPCRVLSGAWAFLALGLVDRALVVPDVARFFRRPPVARAGLADVPRFAFFAVLCHAARVAAAVGSKATTAGLIGFSICGAGSALRAASHRPLGASARGVGRDRPAGEVAAAGCVQIALVRPAASCYAGREWAGAPPAARSTPDRAPGPTEPDTGQPETPTRTSRRPASPARPRPARCSARFGSPSKSTPSSYSSSMSKL